MIERTIDFRIMGNVSKDYIIEEFKKVGILDCDEIIDDSFHYDMITDIDLDDVSEKTKKSIEKFYCSEYDLTFNNEWNAFYDEDGKEIDFRTKLNETVFIDVDSGEGYYAIADYSMFALGDVGSMMNTEWFDETDENFKFPQIEKVKKMLDSIECISTKKAL